MSQMSLGMSLDRQRVEDLTAKITVAVRPTLAAQPYSRDNVFVALNALATVAAFVIAGTDGEGLSFFELALQQQLDQVKRDFAT